MIFATSLSMSSPRNHPPYHPAVARDWHPSTLADFPGRNGQPRRILQQRLQIPFRSSHAQNHRHTFQLAMPSTAQSYISSHRPPERQQPSPQQIYATQQRQTTKPRNHATQQSDATQPCSTDAQQCHTTPHTQHCHGTTSRNHATQ